MMIPINIFNTLICKTYMISVYNNVLYKINFFQWFNKVFPLNNKQYIFKLCLFHIGKVTEIMRDHLKLLI